MASPGTEHEDKPAGAADGASARDDGTSDESQERASEKAAGPVERKAEPPVAPKAEPPVAPKAEPTTTSPMAVSPAVDVPPVEASPPTELYSGQALPPVHAPVLATPPQEPAAAATEPAREAERPRLVARLGPRPSGAWLAVFGAVAVLTFAAGVLTGRGLRSDPGRRATPAPVPPKAVAPSGAAPVAVAPTGNSAEVPIARPRMPATQGKSGSLGFNAQAAKLAIDRIVPRLKACKQVGEPPGSATVTVTFAPSGRVSSAQVTTTRYAGTRTGNCIAQRLREARIPEFTGAPVTVKRSVAVR